ncbi:MAG: DegT/DnrJ/EryC1/StrS family aminotransferase [Myxococcales bacterium]|nr:DegT/DnrJ/EryC1/StrS family aminotransferase [Myxococcales bacterium]
MATVRFFDMQAELTAQRETLKAAVARVIDSGGFVLGEEVAAFERELASHLGAANVIGVSSGTDALLCALLASDIGPGDEVITTPLSFISTASAIARVGATPVFADIDPITLCLDPLAVLARRTERTKAVVVVHLFGALAQPIGEELRDLIVIEDAAQRLDRPQIGYVSTLSFFPTKHLGGAGDGGAVVCEDEAMAARVRRLRQHGAARKYEHHELGGNFRLDVMQAAFLRVRLTAVSQAIAARQRAASRYRELLTAVGLQGLIAQAAAPTHRYQQFALRVPGRDAVRAALLADGIETEVYYPTPLHQQPCFAALPQSTCPNAELACNELLALPFYSTITLEIQQQVVAALARITSVM